MLELPLQKHQQMEGVADLLLVKFRTGVIEESVVSVIILYEIFPLVK